MENQLTMIDSDTVIKQSLYERDFYKWTFQTANLLRQGRFSEIDIDNVAEEIESMGISNKKELISRLSVLIMHLLKWQYVVNMRSNSWIRTINTQRRELELLFENSPSLKHDIEIFIEKAFNRAKADFERETGISRKTLPETCPYSVEQLTDDDFFA